MAFGRFGLGIVWYPDIWTNTSVDVSVKVFLYVINFKSVSFFGGAVLEFEHRALHLIGACSAS
jgi:hypothetical protein